MMVKGTFGNIFDGLTALVTGHTGFKGSWLSIWLRELGANVVGYSLDPPTEPSNFVLSHLKDRLTDVRGDVRDFEHLQQTIAQCRPQVIFHLAAQPLVLPSYQAPKETLDTNVGGTINLLEAVRHTGTIRAVVVVTTDKVYRNREWLWGYREIDELGGHDPYSASKAMAELAISSYRQSFFAPQHGVAVASARAGNVIGGGDWSERRLVPDCVRALVDHQPIHLRNPDYVRPWQLLLEPLSGYLWLAAKLLGEDGHRYAEAWNLGPQEHRSVTTEELVQKAIALWGDGTYTTGTTQTEVETKVLRLDWDKAANRLGWHSIYTWEEALTETMVWYKTYHAQQNNDATPDMYDICVAQIERYVRRARESRVEWAK
jgi:CDP-glucose 4,6-dehydratase